MTLPQAFNESPRVPATPEDYAIFLRARRRTTGGCHLMRAYDREEARRLAGLHALSHPHGEDWRHLVRLAVRTVHATFVPDFLAPTKGENR